MPKTYAAGDQLSASDYNAVVKTAGLYAASSAGSDTYAITVSPVPTTYAAGDVYHFKADVANTGACTINVNSLGAKSIQKMKSGALADLETGDLAADQYNTIIYTGTVFQLLSQFGSLPTQSFAGASTAELSTAGAGISNTDTTYTPGFKAKTLQLFFKIKGKTGTPSDTCQWGIANFVGTTLTSSFALSTLSAGTTVSFSFDPGVSTGSAGSGDADASQVTLSITNITATQFTVRAAWDTGGSAGAGSATAQFQVLAWG